MKQREAFLMAERERKGKGPAKIPLRKSNRIPSKMVTIKERGEDQPTVDISSSDEDDILYEESNEDYTPTGYGVIAVEISDKTEKIVSSFSGEEDREIYALKGKGAVRNRVHQAMVLKDLENLEVESKLIRQLIRIGFGWFIQLGKMDVPVMLAEEFFTTFRFVSTTDLDRISVSFRLLGLDWEMDLMEWSIRLGVISNSVAEVEYWRKCERGVPGKSVPFDGRKEWKHVARKGAPMFEANKSAGDDIADPLLRMAQVYLGYNLLGQGSCVTRVSLTELYFMRRIQDGVGVDLGFWLAYQSHQINRSKTRHLNLCHIVGVFLRNNIEMIHARKRLQLEMCMSPRPFDLCYLLEFKIIRETAGGYAFYEPGKAAPKLRTRIVLQEGGEQVIKPKDEDKETVGWLVNAHLSLEEKVDKMYTMVHDMWKSFKEEQEKKKKAEKNQTNVVEEDDKGSNHGEKEEDNRDEIVAGQILAEMDAAGKKELVKLAVQAVLFSSNEAGKKRSEAGTSTTRPRIPPTVPRKKRDPPRRSPEDQSPRSKRGR